MFGLGQWKRGILFPLYHHFPTRLFCQRWYFPIKMEVRARWLLGVPAFLDSLDHGCLKSSSLHVPPDGQAEEATWLGVVVDIAEELFRIRSQHETEIADDSIEFFVGVDWLLSVSYAKFNILLFSQLFESKLTLILFKVSFEVLLCQIDHIGGQVGRKIVGFRPLMLQHERQKRSTPAGDLQNVFSLVQLHHVREGVVECLRAVSETIVELIVNIPSLSDFFDGGYLNLRAVLFRQVHQSVHACIIL